MKIYFNGSVYLGHGEVEQAFVVENGKFIFVGSNKDTLAKFPTGEKFDLQGRFVTCGFNDSHMHLIGLGMSLSLVDLHTGITSIPTLIDKLSQNLKDAELEDQWLKGRGWNQDLFIDEKTFPTRYDLDNVSTTIPICIIRACGHIVVINSKALEILGLDKSTALVDGGQIDVDLNGIPTGIFRENAINLVYDAMPRPSRQMVEKMIIDGCHELSKHGITSCQSDDFETIKGYNAYDIIDIFEGLKNANKLPVRIYQQAQITSLEELKKFVRNGYTTGKGDTLFKIGPLKLLGDGSLGARTAYLMEPYQDDPENFGIPVYTQEFLDEMIIFAHKNSMQIAIHGIGDRIMNMIISSIEKAQSMYKIEDHRHGIIHCQITTPEILNKFEELNLHAYIQSIFLDYDIKIIEKRIGKKRAKSTYNFKTLTDTVWVSNGSDAPVETVNPMKGIQCAVTRTDLEGKNQPFLMDQALSIMESIDSYTINGARASFEENIKGLIKSGYLADFVIWSDNPFKIWETKIGDIQAEKTYLEGNLVYSK